MGLPISSGCEANRRILRVAFPLAYPWWFVAMIDDPVTAYRDVSPPELDDPDRLSAARTFYGHFMVGTATTVR